MSKPGGKVIVLDTWAMMTFLDAEPAAQEVRQLLRRARGKEVLVLFSLINYGECLYVIEREHDEREVQRAIGIIDQLALHVIPADRKWFARIGAGAVLVQTLMEIDPQFRRVSKEQRDGYRIERVIYESRPHHHITAILYLPDSPPPFTVHQTSN